MTTAPPPPPGPPPPTPSACCWTTSWPVRRRRDARTGQALCPWPLTRRAAGALVRGAAAGPTVRRLARARLERGLRARVVGGRRPARPGGAVQASASRPLVTPDRRAAGSLGSRVSVPTAPPPCATPSGWAWRSASTARRSGPRRRRRAERWQAMSLSALMFTGASQFALVGVLGAGGGALAAVGSALLLGTRNTVYGVRLVPLLRPRGHPPAGTGALGHRRDDGDGARRPDRALGRLAFLVDGRGDLPDVERDDRGRRAGRGRAGWDGAGGARRRRPGCVPGPAVAAAARGRSPRRRSSGGWRWAARSSRWR